MPDFAWPAIKQARCSNGNLEVTVRNYNIYGEMIMAWTISKAAEHCRTPKRRRDCKHSFLACVLECGAAAPL